MKRLLVLVLLIPFAASGQMVVGRTRSLRTPDFQTLLSPQRQAASAVPVEEELPGGMRGELRVIWSGREFLAVGRGAEGLVATRIDEDGRVVDDPPLVIDTGSSQVRDVAFDGVNYLIVYVGDWQGGYGSSLYARRIAATDDRLHLLDPAPIQISRAEWPATGWIYDATVSFGGGYFLVAWSRQTELAYDVATVRLTAAGEIVGEPVSLWSRLGSEEAPRAAFDGRRFLVVWNSRGSVGATFVEPESGVTLFPLELYDPAGSSQVALLPHVAWSGSRYLVAWSAGEFPHDVRVEGVLLGPAGGEARFSLPPSEDPRFITGASWDGSTFVISWNAGFYDCRLSNCPPPEYRMGFARLSPEAGARAEVIDLGSGILAAHASTRAGRTLFLHQKDDRTWARLLDGRHGLFPGDLVAGLGSYPNFDAGESEGSIHVIREGTLSEALDSYTTWSQGPNDLVNGVSVSSDGSILFDREESLASLRNGEVTTFAINRKIANWVQDRAGNVYFASGYGTPLLEKLTPAGETGAAAVLQGASGWQLALDLASDQCTLWYSALQAEGIFQLDICRAGEARAITPRAAKTIRVLPDGGALVALQSGIARLDAAGGVRAEVRYRLWSDGRAPDFVSFSIDAERSTVWIGEGSRSGNNLVYKVDLDDLSSLLVAYPVSSQYLALSALAVYPEWRASTFVDPRSRRRPAGRH